jgi:hypothetical protein
MPGRLSFRHLRRAAGERPSGYRAAKRGYKFSPSDMGFQNFQYPTTCCAAAHGARGARGESDVSAKRSSAAMYPAFECSRFGCWP